MKISRPTLSKALISLMMALLTWSVPGVGWAQGPPEAPTLTGERRLITAVEVRNNRTVGTDTILVQVTSRVGELYSPEAVNDDIKRLFATGYFADVKVEIEEHLDGVKLIIMVTEKPVVDRVEFLGHRLIQAKELRKAVKLKAGELFDQRRLKADVDEIKKLYEEKGYFKAQAKAEAIIDPQTNHAVVTFTIKEEERVQVGAIRFTGNQAFPAKRLIKLVKTKRAGWWFWQRGYFKEEQFTADLEAIKAFYQDNGFLDVGLSHQMDFDPQKRMSITIVVEEGRQYRAGEITFVGQQAIAVDELRRSMKMLTGEVYSQSKLNRDVVTMQGAYFDRGYVDVEIQPQILLNPQTGLVDVTYQITEHEIAFVERIEIRGNTRTRDKVIRRELRIFPGEQFQGEKLKRSKERLYNLGYFEEVSFDVEPGTQPQYRHLIVTVKETKTGAFSFGGGFSSVARLLGFVELEQRNFDLWNWKTFTGGGQDLKIRAELGTLRQNYLLSFTEPWIFDRPLSWGFDLYRLTTLRQRGLGFGFDEERQGGATRLGKEFGEYTKANLTYRLERDRISDVVAEASADLKREEGTNTVSSLMVDLAYDRRDYAFAPTRGFRLYGSMENAGGFIGGDRDFWKFFGDADFFFPIFERYILELRARAGLANDFGDSDFVPIFERFFAGGANTIRGYKERRVGPRDSISNDPIGGESLFVGNAEFTFPIFDPVKGAVFFDAGNVWRQMGDWFSDELKAGAGVGARVKTPIGPIQVDFGFPLNPDTGESERGRFHFNVSRGF